MIRYLIQRTPFYPTLRWLRSTVRRQLQIQRWNAQGCPIPPPPAVKHCIIVDYARKFGLEVLIETGTCLGNTIAATRNHFAHIYSIELSQVLHEQAKSRFGSDPAVTLLAGDSATVLRTILPEINASPLFWLDAHYSGGTTARGNLDTPILEELDAIFSFCQRSVILIDDARLFTGKNSYPTLDHLGEYVAKVAPGSQMQIKHDIIRLVGNIEK